MNRLSDNDRNWGPFTLGRWHKTLSAYIEGGDDECRKNQFLIAGFGWALRVTLPAIIQPFGKYREHCQRYGFSLSDMGNGYDFLQIFYGPQTHDSTDTKSWCTHFPWKEWKHVRRSVYKPDGTHFYTDDNSKNWIINYQYAKACLACYFKFQDFDGQMIIATCMIEEREWHRGRGWFQWLKYFYKPKIRRSLDLKFSEEVGPEKGSWKGGTVGHGIDMLPGETPEMAFRRYCSMVHDARHGRKFTLTFVGPCGAPSPRPATAPENCANQAA